MLLRRPAWQAAEPGDGVIHSCVTGYRRFRHGPFGIKILIFVP